MNRKNNSFGFTLVEVLVTIVVMGIITGMSIPLIRNIQKSLENRKYTVYMDSMISSAKLYVNSYEEDLFGHEDIGCAIITYQQMSDRKLLKDIDSNDVSCASSKSFVKVLKYEDQYSYVGELGCGNKKENGSVDVQKTVPSDLEDESNVCRVDAESIMTIKAVPGENPTYKKSQKIDVQIKSNTGINLNPIIQYGFSYQNDTNVIGGSWTNLGISLKGRDVQKAEILGGHAITTSSKINTPSGVSGELYLVLKITRLTNLSGKNWSKDGQEYVMFGPYKIDNEKPLFNDSNIISNSLTPQLDLKVTDNVTNEDNLKMCISFDTNSCKTTTVELKEYKKYEKDKVLDKISDSYDGSTHKIFVTVVDEALNYEVKEFDYKVSKELPSCTLEAVGTKGDNDWYTDDVTIRFKSKVADSYGISTSLVADYNNKSSVIQSDTKEITYYGYVKNEAGEEKCSITVKVDTKKPTLDVVLRSNGEIIKSNQLSKYDVIQSFTKKDDMSGIEFVYYMQANDYNNKKGNKSNWKKVENQDTYTYNKDISSDVYYRAYDKAGNYSNDVHIIVKIKKNSYCGFRDFPVNYDVINLRYEASWGKDNNTWCGQGNDDNGKKTCSATAYYLPKGQTSHARLVFSDSDKWKVEILCDNDGSEASVPSGTTIINSRSSDGKVVCYRSKDNAGVYQKLSGKVTYAKFLKVKILVYNKAKSEWNPNLLKRMSSLDKITNVTDFKNYKNIEFLTNDPNPGDISAIFYMSDSFFSKVNCA